MISLFLVYGWSQGHDPVRALCNLLSPHPDPVESNPELPAIAKHRVSWLGDIENRELSESSGLAASVLHDDVLWSINDSGGEASLYAMTYNGRHLATVSIDIEKPLDWESLDSFELDGRAYIAIADVGDNLGWRSSVQILVVQEPAVLKDDVIDLAWKLEFTYPDGPRDSEAIAVDANKDRVMILSKRDYPQRLYEVPLQQGGEARLLGELAGLPKPTYADFDEEPDTAQYRHMPTGMSYASDGRLLITTYKHAYLYESFKSEPLLIPMPKVGQREAIAWTGRDTAVVSRERFEGVGVSDLFQIEFIEF